MWFDDAPATSALSWSKLLTEVLTEKHSALSEDFKFDRVAEVL